MSKEGKDKQEFFLTLSSKDFSTVKDLAGSVFLRAAADRQNVDAFLARCYTEAVLQMISGKGYILIKQSNQEDKNK